MVKLTVQRFPFTPSQVRGLLIDAMTQKPKPKDSLPFPTSENHEKPSAKPPKPVRKKPADTPLDRGIEESFPASDPVSVNVTKISDKK